MLLLMLFLEFLVVEHVVVDVVVAILCYLLSLSLSTVATVIIVGFHT